MPTTRWTGSWKCLATFGASWSECRPSAPPQQQRGTGEHHQPRRGRFQDGTEGRHVGEAFDPPAVEVGGEQEPAALGKIRRVGPDHDRALERLLVRVPHVVAGTRRFAPDYHRPRALVVGADVGEVVAEVVDRRAFELGGVATKGVHAEVVVEGEVAAV